MNVYTNLAVVICPNLYWLEKVFTHKNTMTVLKPTILLKLMFKKTDKCLNLVLCLASINLTLKWFKWSSTKNTSTKKLNTRFQDINNDILYADTLFCEVKLQILTKIELFVLFCCCSKTEHDENGPFWRPSVGQWQT